MFYYLRRKIAVDGLRRKHGMKNNTIYKQLKNLGEGPGFEEEVFETV